MTVSLPMIDLGECLTSGQVFRFRRTFSGWHGVDGANEYRFADSIQEPISEDLARFLRLDWDYSEVLAELVSLGPELEPLLGGLGGVRLLRPSCAREALFSFMCTANNHIARISQMVDKLARFGQSMSKTARRWPELEVIASIHESELRQLGFGYRAKAIPLAAAELVHWGGEHWFAEAKALSTSDLETALTELPGIGPKLAGCIALYGFDRTDAVPVDTHVWRAAQWVYRERFANELPTDRIKKYAAEHIRGRFGNLAALAQQVLFYTSLRELWPQNR